MSEATIEQKFEDWLSEKRLVAVDGAKVDLLSAETQPIQLHADDERHVIQPAPAGAAGRTDPNLFLWAITTHPDEEEIELTILAPDGVLRLTPAFARMLAEQLVNP